MVRPDHLRGENQTKSLPVGCLVDASLADKSTISSRCDPNMSMAAYHWEKELPISAFFQIFHAAGSPVTLFQTASCL